MKTFHNLLITILLCKINKKDKDLIKIAQTNKDYSIQNSHMANKTYSLVCRNCKIVIPKQLENQVVEWYHNALYHPRQTCIELRISQHF